MKLSALVYVTLAFASLPALASEEKAVVRTKMIRTCSSYMYSMNANGYVCSGPNYTQVVDEMSLGMQLTQMEMAMSAMETRLNRLEAENAELKFRFEKSVE